MSKIVDPSPWIAARLVELAEEYRPSIAEADGRLRDATDRGERRQLRKERRHLKRQYRHARREAEALRALPW